MFTTSCKDCIFADILESKGHKEQVGCLAGKLEIFGERDELLWHEGPNHYTVNRLCNLCRDHNWGRDKDGMPFDDVLEIARKEVEINYDLLIYEDGAANPECDGDLDLAMAKLESVVGRIDRQQILPSKVIFIVNNKALRTAALTTRVAEVFQGTGLKYMTSYIMNDVTRVGEAVDIVFDKVKSQFYVVVNNGVPLIESFSADMNWLVNERMEQFVMVEPYERSSGLTVLRLAHEVLHGNLDYNIEDKIIDQNNKSSKKKAIYTWPQITQLQQSLSLTTTTASTSLTP